jgi:hypothetical protein
VCRFQTPLGLGLSNPKKFKISYNKGHDLFPTSQREEEEARETQKYEREREREKAWINWGAEERVQKRVREGVGGKLGSKKRDKKQKAGSLDKLGRRRGTKTKKQGVWINWGACKFVREKRREKRRFV